VFATRPIWYIRGIDGMNSVTQLSSVSDHMLKKIHINNYRSCKDVVIEPSGSMVVLVGRNGVGKSNVLRAIYWASHSAISPGPIEVPDPRSQVETVVNLDFVVEQKRYSYDLSVTSRSAGVESAGTDNIPGQNGISLVERFAADGSQIVDRSGSNLSLEDGRLFNIPSDSTCLPLLLAMLPSDDPMLVSIQPFVEFLSGVRYYPFEEPSDLPRWNSVVSEDEYKIWVVKRQIALNSQTSPSILHILHMFLENRPLFQELLSLLGRDGLSIVDDIQVKHFDVAIGTNSGRPDHEAKRRWYFFSFVPSQCAEGERKDFEYGDLSMGTRRVIRIITSVLGDDCTVLLGEHPEDGIHMGLTRKLMGLLRSYSALRQIVLSSHSLVVFNALLPEDVRLVTMTTGETRVRALSDTEVIAAKKFIEEDGTLSDVLESIQDE
jgi:ABC-type Na+ transport system ATPase subunit NatA